MPFRYRTRLQILFWEIKNRFFYVAVSFFLSFLVSYQNSKFLLYFFVSSYSSCNNEVDSKTVEEKIQDTFDFANNCNSDSVQSNSFKNAFFFKPFFEKRSFEKPLSCEASEATKLYLGENPLFSKITLPERLAWLTKLGDAVLPKRQSVLYSSQFAKGTGFIENFFDTVISRNFAFASPTVKAANAPPGQSHQQYFVQTPKTFFSFPFPRSGISGISYKYKSFAPEDQPLSILLYFYKVLNSIRCQDVSSIFFIFTDVEEAFSSQILICLIFSFVIIVPLLIYEIFSFLAPSLYFYEKQKWFFRISFVTVLWYFFLYNVQFI